MQKDKQACTKNRTFHTKEPGRIIRWARLGAKPVAMAVLVDGSQA